MAAREKTYVGNVGTIIDLDTEVTITGATEVLIVALKPDETEVEWTGEIEGTTIVRYTTEVDDLDQEGVWRLQAKVTTADGTWRGNTVTMAVYPEFG